MVSFILEQHAICRIAFNGTAGILVPDESLITFIYYTRRPIKYISFIYIITSVTTHKDVVHCTLFTRCCEDGDRCHKQSINVNVADPSIDGCPCLSTVISYTCMTQCRFQRLRASAAESPPRPTEVARLADWSCVLREAPTLPRYDSFRSLLVSM